MQSERVALSYSMAKDFGSKRLFWLVCIVASWYYCFLLMMSSWDGYQNNAISLGTETDYTFWNTSLFSVSVCESKNKKGVYATGERLWGKGHNPNLDEVLLDIAYFKGDHYFLKKFCQPGPSALNCPKEDFRNLSKIVRSNCSSLFEKCTWLDETFDCCKHFLPLQTERGLCFTINSLQTEKQNPKPLISNKYSGPGTLTLEIRLASDVYVHAPEDVPNMNSMSSEMVNVQQFLQKRRVYNILEMTNDVNVKDVDVSKRRCIFPEENTIPIYKYYSYSVCIVNCRIRQQLRLCNCTNHLTPGVDESKACDIDGLLCLIDNYVAYSVLVNPWTVRPGLNCDCLPSCVEPEYDLIESIEYTLDSSIGIVEFDLENLPTLRLRRSVVRGQLDLVVSLGGAAGLFAGGSLLSFVELFYYFTLRAYYTRKIKNQKEIN